MNTQSCFMWCAIAVLTCSLASAQDAPVVSPVPMESSATASTAAASTTAAAPTTPAPATSAESPRPPSDERLAAIEWEEYIPDNTFVGPFAHDFSMNEQIPERQADWTQFTAKLAAWPPGQVFDNEEKIRNLLCVCALFDLAQDQFESEVPLFIYQRLRREVPDAKLKDVLGIIAFHTRYGKIITEIDAFNLGSTDEQVRERLHVYAMKMLGRVLGKLPREPSTE